MIVRQTGQHSLTERSLGFLSRLQKALFFHVPLGVPVTIQRCFRACCARFVAQIACVNTE